jgi:hypothetical protein
LSFCQSGSYAIHAARNIRAKLYSANSLTVSLAHCIHREAAS